MGIGCRRTRVAKKIRGGIERCLFQEVGRKPIRRSSSQPEDELKRGIDEEESRNKIDQDGPVRSKREVQLVIVVVYRS